MINILLILSSAYCNAELQVEFGPVPAALIPVGGTSLFELQTSTLKPDYTLLTLPDDNDFAHCDWHLPLDPHLTVSQAVHRAMVYINNTVEEDYRLHVLHGDTLVTELMDQDGVGVVTADPSFEWMRLSGDQSYCGYFSVTRNSSISFGFDMDTILTSLPRVRMDGKWHDYGHASTYWNSRATHLSTRSFNELDFPSSNYLVKRGPEQKIQAEFNWFVTIPPSLSMYTPKVSRNGVDSYLVQYCPNPSLAEIWVHGNKSDEWWISTLQKCLDFIDRCVTYPRTSNDPLFLQKSMNRLKESPYQTKTAEKAIERLSEISMDQLKCNVIHGDFCFSNILYESRVNTLRLIDPRGLNSAGDFDLGGSPLYDLSKLFHSLVGGYDFIVQNRPIKTRPLLTDFLIDESCKRGYSRDHLFLSTGLLFASMVPLHIKESKYRAKILADRGEYLFQLANL